MIYFIENSTSGMIKIGYTKRLTKRLKALRGQTGENLRVMAVKKGNRTTEWLLHHQFLDLRVDLEWFRPGEALLDYIKGNATEWDGTDEIVEDEGRVNIRLGPDLKQKARRVYDYQNGRIYGYVGGFNGFLLYILNKGIEKEFDEIKQEMEKLRQEIPNMTDEQRMWDSRIRFMDWFLSESGDDQT
jgi:hypothetical protein